MMISRIFNIIAVSLVLTVQLKVGCSFTITTPRTIITTTPLDDSRGNAFCRNESFEFFRSKSSLKMAEETPASQDSGLPMLLDPGTKGGALFLSLVLFVVPILGYETATIGFGVDGIEAGRWIGVGFTFFTTVLWVGTYIFRVATKDMTYAKQLKDYENAVIAKRLEELDEDEIQALVEDIERDDF